MSVLLLHGNVYVLIIKKRQNSVCILFLMRILINFLPANTAFICLIQGKTTYFVSFKVALNLSWKVREEFMMMMSNE